MPREIERKFLVSNDGWRVGADSGRRLVQGYLARGGECTVRVRVAGNEAAWLTLKGRPQGIARAEYEYPIPPDEACELLTMCASGLVEKTRYLVRYADHVWEVDVFAGENEGLVVAEVELEDESEQPAIPPWAGREVTDEARYFNSRLAARPYSRWSPEERGA